MKRVTFPLSKVSNISVTDVVRANIYYFIEGKINRFIIFKFIIEFKQFGDFRDGSL